VAALEEQARHLTERLAASQGLTCSLIRIMYYNQQLIRRLCLLLAHESGRLDQPTALAALDMDRATYARALTLATTGVAAAARTHAPVPVPNTAT
jgi:hypothetical protein